MGCYLDAFLGRARVVSREGKSGKEMKVWDALEILRHPGDPREARDEKIHHDPRNRKMARKQEKLWIIVHEFGRPQGPGTGAHGMHPMDVGGPLKAHSCPRRGMWCRPEALLGLARSCQASQWKAKVDKEWKFYLGLAHINLYWDLFQMTSDTISMKYQYPRLSALITTSIRRPT